MTAEELLTSCSVRTHRSCIVQGGTSARRMFVEVDDDGRTLGVRWNDRAGWDCPCGKQSCEHVRAIETVLPVPPVPFMYWKGPNGCSVSVDPSVFR